MSESREALELWIDPLLPEIVMLRASTAAALTAN